MGSNQWCSHPLLAPWHLGDPPLPSLTSRRRGVLLRQMGRMLSGWSEGTPRFQTDGHLLAQVVSATCARPSAALPSPVALHLSRRETLSNSRTIPRGSRHSRGAGCATVGRSSLVHAGKDRRGTRLVLLRTCSAVMPTGRLWTTSPKSDGVPERGQDWQDLAKE
jgi:hypothetical protein